MRPDAVKFRNRQYSLDDKRKKYRLFRFGNFSRFFYFRSMNNKLFTTKKLCLCAMISALSFGLTFLEVPIFPIIGLKLDFSMLGAIYAEMSVAVVILLSLLKTSSGGIGEIANFIMAQPFVVLPALVYQFKKGLKSVIITLIIATILQIGISLLCNRFIMYPLYFGNMAGIIFKSPISNYLNLKAWHLIIIFNFIKCLLNGIITILLYKRLKKLLHFFIKSSSVFSIIQ